MVLYTKPIGTKTKHGNIRIEISKITVEYIDAKLAEFYIKSEICYNVQEYERAIQHASSHKDTLK